MKGVLEKLGLGMPKIVAGSEAKQVLTQITEEFIEARRQQGNLRWDGIRSLKDSPRWVALMGEPGEFQIDVALAALDANKRGIGGTGDWSFWLRREAPFAVARFILQKKKLVFRDDQIAGLMRRAAKAEYLTYQFPVATILGATERHLDGKRPEAAVRAAIEAFVRRVESERWPTKVKQKMGARAEAMLEPAASGLILPKGAFAAKLEAWAGNDAAREALVAHLAAASEKSKPTKAWLKAGSAEVRAVGAAKLWRQVTQWIEEETPDPAAPDASHELLKALIWLAPPKLVPELGRFCQLCYKKIPQIGARSIKLGNACLLTLEGMGDDKVAVAELSRLSREIKYASVRDQIAKRLARVALVAGVSVDELEDRSLPDFGLDPEGRAEESVGDYSAVVALSPLDVSLSWVNADGKALKSVPKPVRDQHGEVLKSLRSRVKDIDGARKSTVARLEAGWLDGLDWDLADWRSSIDGHPVRRQIARALIWQVAQEGAPVVGMPVDTGWIGQDGTPVRMPDEGRISLWHPLDSDPETVLAWRRLILKRGLTQPIKQAHREVYVLTDAERRTEVYSNRFAAHILRQHQFKALCDARGWRFDLMGAHFDGHNTPQRKIPSRELIAEYTVEVVEGGATEMGIATHVATDQLCFLDGDYNRVPLIEVPPIVFSELMRDVDLFVAVSSVANDPNWTDGGPDGQFGHYWQNFAFGDLTQSAETRKQLLEDLLPSLAIGDSCRIDGNFLIVKGSWYEYAIHLGSSNIQIRPSNRYLCIVPGHSQKQQVRLPFAGDTRLSVILSKAYMLIEDHKITDQTILSQLGK